MQFAFRVVVDSHRRTVRVVDAKPEDTPATEPKEKQVVTDKDTKTFGKGLDVTAAANPGAKLTISRTRAKEKAKANETTNIMSGIIQKQLYGAVSWAFDVDDQNAQLHGVKVSGDRLPFVDLAFPDVFGEPPKNMDLVVASYWSKISAPVSATERTGVWNLWKVVSKSAGNASTPSYTNLCEIVSVKTTPLLLQPKFHYCATVNANLKCRSLLIEKTVVHMLTGKSVDVAHNPICGRYDLAHLWH